MARALGVTVYSPLDIKLLGFQVFDLPRGVEEVANGPGCHLVFTAGGNAHTVLQGPGRVAEDSCSQPGNNYCIKVTREGKKNEGEWQGKARQGTGYCLLGLFWRAGGDNNM